jgi:hypothetical protein
MGPIGQLVFAGLLVIMVVASVIDLIMTAVKFS